MFTCPPTTGIVFVVVNQATAVQTALRRAREARGLSLREAARRSSVDASHLSRAERGRGTLSLAALLRIAEVVGLFDLQRLLEAYAPAGCGNEPVMPNARGEVVVAANCPQKSASAGSQAQG